MLSGDPLGDLEQFMAVMNALPDEDLWAIQTGSARRVEGGQLHSRERAHARDQVF
jgi:hypothetical protein